MRKGDFESVTPVKSLEQTKGTHQKEELANYTFAALHLKLTILEG